MQGCSEMCRVQIIKGSDETVLQEETGYKL